MLRLIRSLRGLDLVGADVVEMNPNYDPAQISALLAATVAAEILALIAAHRRDRRTRRGSTTSGQRRARGGSPASRWPP